jgi:hypothetical protein
MKLARFDLGCSGSEMPTEPSERAGKPPGSPGCSRRKLLVGAFATATVVLVLSGGVIYLLRGPIGAGLAGAYLRSHGAQTRIRIDRLDASGFAGTLELGDPRDPDLAVDHLEVTFAPGYIWRRGLAAPRIQSIRLVRPRLKLTYDGKRLRLGSLQRFVDEISARPAAGQKGPEIDIRDGRVTLATPAGALVLVGDARMAGGRISRVDARLQPAQLASGNASAGIAGGVIHIVGGPGLRGRMNLRVARLKLGELEVRDLVAGSGLRGAYPAAGQETFGPVDLAVQVSAAGVIRSGQRLQAPSAFVTFAGFVRGPLDRLAVAGDAHLDTSLGPAAVGPAKSEGLSGQLVLTSLQARLGRDWRLDTPIAGRLSISRPGFGDARSGMSFETVQWSGRGDLAADSSGLTGGFKGGARASRASLAKPLPFSRELQDAILDGPDLELDLKPGRLRLTASQPIRLSGARGLTATLSARPGAALYDGGAGNAVGAFDLLVSGPGRTRLKLSTPGYSVRGIGPGSSIDARTSVSASLDGDAVGGGALTASGRASFRSGRLSFVADSCFPAEANALMASGQPFLTSASVSVCPIGGPLFQAAAGGWSFAAVLRKARATAPKLGVQVSDAEAQLDLAGRGPVTGSVVVVAATIADTAAAAERRFQPVRASGRMESAGRGPWNGEFQLVEAGHGRPIGRALVSHDLVSGRGEARLEAADLGFARGGLQPADILPFMSALASQTDGRVDFEGWTRWTDGSVTSGGRLVAHGLAFRSMIGKVTGFSTDLKFSSLAPLGTAPDQSASATEIQSLTPLKNVLAKFDLRPAALHLESAQANALGGTLALKPMEIPYAAPHAASGVLAFSSLDLGAAVASSGFSDRVSAQAKVDGEVRFQMAADGLKITGGRAYAIAPGRLSIKRAALTGAVASGGAGSSPDAMRELTYQALEDLAFDRLDATIEPKPSGRLGALFHIAGRHDPAIAPDARINILDALSGKAFKKSIPLPKGTPINLTLDTSINFDELMHEYLAAHGGSAGVQP